MYKRQGWLFLPRDSCTLFFLQSNRSLSVTASQLFKDISLNTLTSMQSSHCVHAFVPARHDSPGPVSHFKEEHKVVVLI